MSFVRGLIQKPLLHFLLLGALLFAIDGWRTPHPEPAIFITRAVERELSRDLARKLGREPEPSELDAALSGWKEEEALYREGLRQRLDRNDAEVRARVVNKLIEVQRSLFVPPEPTNAELEAWLNEHRARYEVPARYDFEHVFVARKTSDPKLRAEQLREKLVRGASRAELGDRFPEGRAFKALTAERLSRSFGRKFADALRNSAPGQWTVLESDHGFHVVRLELTEGGLPAREVLGPRLVADYRAAALDRALARYVNHIQAGYAFREAP